MQQTFSATGMDEQTLYVAKHYLRGVPGIDVIDYDVDVGELVVECDERFDREAIESELIVAGVPIIDSPSVQRTTRQRVTERVKRLAGY